MTPHSKEFVIRHVTEKFSQLDLEEPSDVTEEHFGISWTLQYVKQEENFEMCILHNDALEYDFGVSVEVYCEFKLFHPNGDITSSSQKRLLGNYVNFTDWSCPLNDPYGCKDDDTLTIEVRVKIGEIIGGSEKQDLIKFDESVKEFSDVVLVVKKRKFYVLKQFLGFQSSYFKSLLMGGFEESQKSEVVLNGIDPIDFQRFLELIHGESSVNDSTVEGILHLADMYDAPVAIRRCEEFLLEKSRKPNHFKLKFSIRYNLENLTKQCLSEINTREDIQSIVDAGLDGLNVSVSNALLLKLLLLT